MSTQAHPDLYYVPYEVFLADLEAVAVKIEADAWQPDFLVGVGRGGLVPAAYLSHRTGITLLSVDHSSGDDAFAGELLAKLAAKSRDGARILVIDDINDSGGTINQLRATLTAHGCDEANIRMAVLINNVSSGARAEYAGTDMDRTDDKRWFVFPWEAVAPRETLIGEAGEVPERIA